MKVAVRFYDKNLRFEIVDWMGETLHKSGTHHNSNNCKARAEKLVRKYKYDVYATCYF